MYQAPARRRTHRENPFAQATYSFLAWFPFLALLVAFCLWLLVGVVHLEGRTFGSEFFSSNAASVDAFQLSLDRKSEAEAAETAAMAELEALERQQERVAAQQH